MNLASARFKLVFDLTRLALKGKSFFNDFDDGAGPWSARDRVRSHGRRAGGNNFIRTRVGHLARVVLHHELRRHPIDENRGDALIFTGVGSLFTAIAAVLLEYPTFATIFAFFSAFALAVALRNAREGG